MMNRTLQARTAEMRDHDCHDWRAWQYVPFELWPDAAIVSYLLGTMWESAFDGHQPTATELRVIVAEAIGPCRVIPTKKDQSS